MVWLAVLAGSLFVTSVANAATLTVCKIGCSFASIQAAVTAAGSGDTVEVRSNGAVGYTQQVTVAKRITLEGDPNGPRPLLKYSASSPTLAFTNVGGGSTLKHMSVVASGSGSDAIVFGQADGAISDVSATATRRAITVQSDGVTVGPDVSATSSGSSALASGGGSATITGVTATTSGTLPAGFVSYGTVTDSTFDGGKSGDGLAMDAGVTVRRVLAIGRNGIVAEGAEVVTDSLVIGTGAQTAAVYASGVLQLRNVTAIAPGPSANGMTAGTGGSITAENVIARGGPGGSDVAASSGGTLQIGYSNFVSSTPGVDVSVGHNQSGDPLFVDGTVGPSQDFHLQIGSPAIGAGTSDAQTGRSDLDGKPRPAAGQSEPSIGAYEPTEDTLNVTIAGSGSGRVSGSGISCPSTCSHNYAPGMVVTLVATPATGSNFGGWSGACSGSGLCQVTMSSERTVTASFTLVPPADRVLPVIGGAAAVGQTLAATDGRWSGAPTSFAYQWQACDTAGNRCASITGATDNVYRVAAGDVGHTLRIVVTASNAGGARSASSAHTAIVTGPPPVLSRTRLSPASFTAKHGTSLRLMLSEAATVNVVITQRRVGRTVHGRCKLGTKQGTRCTLIVQKARLAFAAKRGADHFTLLIKKLAPGRYTATITARAGGATSKPIKLNFTIKRRQQN